MRREKSQRAQQKCESEGLKDGLSPRVKEEEEEKKKTTCQIVKRRGAQVKNRPKLKEKWKLMD